MCLRKYTNAHYSSSGKYTNLDGSFGQKHSATFHIADVKREAKEAFNRRRVDSVRRIPESRDRLRKLSATQIKGLTSLVVTGFMVIYMHLLVMSLPKVFILVWI